MHSLSSLLKKNWLLVVLIFFLSNLALFYKFYFQKLLPFPGDLLVSFFFPWNSGGFPGFDSWTTHKEFIASDVVRQMYPWKVFAFDLIKQGQLPLWNPYNFSGYPLIANLQSSVFFIGNLFFLFLSPLASWLILVLTLLTSFGVFNYLFFRSLKLSWPASLFAALVSTNISYLVVWHEQLIITQVAIFLPLTLWAINNYLSKGSRLFFILIPLFLTGAIYGGHAQTCIYLYLIVAPYLLFKKVPLKRMIFFFLVPLLLGAAQLLPTLEIYLNSARESAATQALFAPFILPWKNLITLLAPDFFGNPATGNAWAMHYGDFQTYFGIAGLVFALLALGNLWREKHVQLFAAIALGGLFLATAPGAFILKNIPILGSGVPARIIFLFEYGLTVLAAFGFDFWWQKRNNFSLRQLFPLALLGLGYLILWFWSLISHDPHWRIALINLILPSGVFLTTTILLLLSINKSLKKFSSSFFLLLLLIIPILEASYFFNKYQPFSPKQFVFPPHPVLSFLQNSAGVNRFYGVGSAYIDNNFATYYRIYSAEGWDSLYIRRYGQLLASTDAGSLPIIYPRSDALFGKVANPNRDRLFDLLGVKYILSKNDTLNSSWQPDFSQFPQDIYQLVWQQNPWQVYQRLTVLPRAFLANKSEVVTEPEKIIPRLYSQDFDFKHSLILENKIKSLDTQAKGTVQILSYAPNKLSLQVNSTGQQLLFLSDSYYPGWKAFEGDREIPIYRADFTFRAVPISAGEHKIIFTYDPASFNWGVIVSLISLGGLMIVTKKYA